MKGVRSRTSRLFPKVVGSLVVAVALPALLGAADFEETALFAFQSDCVASDCDPIGQGDTDTYTHLTGDWSMQRGFGEGPSVHYSHTSPPASWTFDFGAVGPVELTPGLYANAQQDPFHATQPYLKISAHGFGCSTTAGWFEVHEIIYDWWGKPILISVDFEQSCNGKPPLNGSLAFSFGGVGPTSFAPGNVLVSNQDVLYEYTPAGTLVQTIYVLASDGTEPNANAGDLVLDASGNLHLYNGNFGPDPVLSSFSPLAGTWQHHPFLDWDGANHGLATTGNYVFASDRKFVTEPADAHGIVRFDLANGFAAQRFGQGNTFADVTVGFDGRLYGSSQNGLETAVVIYDPTTLAQLGTVTLDEPVRGLAVNAFGQIYGAGDEIFRFNADGSVAASVDPPLVGLLFDIDLDRSGRIVASALDEDIVITTEALGPVTSIAIANLNDLHVAWVQPPPATLLHSADFESGSTSGWDGASGSFSGLLAVNVAAAATGSFGLSVTVGTSCSDTVDLVVPGPTAAGLYKGCNSVTASGVGVVSPGATFAAGQSVVLDNDFSAGAGGGADFTAAIDPGFLSRLGYVETRLPAPEAAYSAEFKVNLDNLTLDPADDIDHLVGYSSTGVEEFRVTLLRNGSENRLILAARLDSGLYDETPFGEQVLLLPGWRTLRFTWRAGAGNGFFLVSVDGLPFVGLSNLDNDTRTVAKVRWGAAGGTIGASTTGNLYLDDFGSWK